MAISSGDGSIILTTKVDETGLKKGLGSMKKLGATASKAFLAIGVGAAAATVAITKMATSAYADYEQLVGGVETLFKGSADKVKAYAENAFYTAGKSANEYLDLTITFANSLIQGLGGDTERAADLANTAIVDMSDNVNRLGSDAQMVEYAYRGLARQEYRMLDNLKLGYQGTAEEMARLINDSKVMGEGFVATAENVRSISFDKYIEAIHEIQVQLGIAGTTSYEATATIQGSAKMMKAAWQNVLSAIAGGGDLDRAINNLVYSITKYFENIVPVVLKALQGIGTLIAQIAPLLVKNIVSLLIQSIPSLIKAIYDMIVGISQGIYEGIKALFTGSKATIKAELNSSVSNTSDSLQSATEGMNSFGDAIEDTNKKAKKSLAGFDELQILSSNTAENLSDFSIPEKDSPIKIGTEINNTVNSEKSENSGFFDALIEQAHSVGEKFMLGFSEGFKGINVEGIASNFQGISESISEIFTNEQLYSSMDGWAQALVHTTGQVAGSLATVGASITENLVGGIDKFLDSNKNDIQEDLISLFEIQTEVVQIAGDTAETFGNILSTIGGNNGQAMTANIMTMFYQAFSGVTELSAKVGRDILDFITRPLINNQEKLSTMFDGFFGVLADLAGGIGELFDHTFSALNNVYDNTLAPFLDVVTEGFSNLFGHIVQGFNSYVLPELQEFASDFYSVMSETLGPAIEKVGEAINKIWNLIEPAVRPIIDLIVTLTGVISDYLLSFVGDVFGSIGELVTQALTWIGDVIGGAADMISGFCDIIQSLFEGNFELILDGLWSLVSGFVNVVASTVETLINFIIGVLNFFLDGINLVVRGVGYIVGQDWEIPSIPELKLPRLATGAVIPPNKEFLAVLGDQKSGTNIEAPLSTIEEAVANVLNRQGMSGGGSSTVIMQIDGREFGRAVLEQGQREERRVGTRLVTT